MVRLIFTVEDSGLGMTTSKVNELLMIDSELSDEELKRLETNNVNMNTIKKLVAKLGGYFTIKSEVGKGTEIKVVVDQKTELEERIDASNYTGREKVLVATNDKSLKNQMINFLDKKDYTVDTSVYSNDVLDRIRLKEKYSYIFLDDSMDKRALEVLQELKKDSKFNTKVIVMIDKDLEIIKNDLIKDGFYEVILKDNINQELERVLK